jgi:hypothetical protein
MSMYSRAGAQGANPDTGLAMGAGLVDAELAARTHYAAPTVPGPQAAPAGMGDAAANYHFGEALPVKYDVPSAAKERMQARQEVRRAAGAANLGQPGVMRTDPISDEEVNYLQAMKDQAELGDFDRYVNSLIDPRKPGNLKWLMEIYPEYVNRRIQQVHTDYEFALRNQMIDSWGINTFDDLHFKYLVDQGKVDGPRLGRHADLHDQYAPGLLSPWSFTANGDNRKGLHLPFASAQHGARPATRSEWAMDDTKQPLAYGRRTAEMAQSMYTPQGQRARDQRVQRGGPFEPGAGPAI